MVVQTLIHGINQRSDERQTLTLLQFQQTQRNSYEQTKALLTQLNTIQDTVFNETDLVLKEMSAQNELMLIQFDKNQELIQQYSIQSYPSIVLVKNNGDIIHYLSDKREKKDIKWLKIIEQDG